MDRPSRSVGGFLRNPRRVRIRARVCAIAESIEKRRRSATLALPHNLCKIPSAGMPELAHFRNSLPPDLAARVEISSELPDDWLARVSKSEGQELDTQPGWLEDRAW